MEHRSITVPKRLQEATEKAMSSLDVSRDSKELQSSAYWADKGKEEKEGFVLYTAPTNNTISYMIGWKACEEYYGIITKPE